jgi:hypothetical protein
MGFMRSWFKHQRSSLQWHYNKLALYATLEANWLAYGRRYAHVKRGGSGLVVSLTSYPPRFGTLHLTLKSLLSQSFVPDRIVLWIARADMALLPAAVTDLQRAGLEIVACDDTRSYKKMIPLLQQGTSAAIVTADDDVYYWRDWLRQLVQARDPAKLEVICHRMHRIKLNADGLPVSYNEWDFETSNTESSPLNFPTGIGGVLYPANVFSPEVLDVHAFMTLCPRGDDIWFWWMARANGATFRRVPEVNEVHCWDGTQEVALWKDNIGATFNDNQIRAMIGAYGFSKERKIA